MDTQPIIQNIELDAYDSDFEVDINNNNVDLNNINDFNNNNDVSTDDVVVKKPSKKAAKPAKPMVDEDDDEEELVYGAGNVIMLFAPVTLCMLCVVVTVSTVSFYTEKGMYLVYTPFHDETDDTGTILWQTVANTLIMLSVVVVMTFLILILYKYKLLKVLYGILMLSTLMMLTMFVYMYMSEVCKTYQLPVDYLSMGLFIWNFGAVGLLFIHWKGPLRVVQMYHIITSSLMALLFIKFLPEWTLWLLLAAISCWDLVAVLCPKGPLKMLVEEAQSRNESTLFPALIYSTTMLIPIITMADGVETVDPAIVSKPKKKKRSSNTPSENVENDGAPPIPKKRVKKEKRQSQQAEPAEEEEERGVKLGLGDFIFYSVLIGKAHSYGDWNTTIACYIAILMGLTGTLFFVAIYRKPLPALPISIFSALVFYFGTSHLIRPFCESLAAHQFYI